MERKTASIKISADIHEGVLLNFCVYSGLLKHLAFSDPREE